MTISPTTGRKNSLGTVVQFLIINYRGQEWKTLGAVLFCPDRDGDYFEIEVNPSWIAFEYVVNNGMEDEEFYSSFNPDYLDSDEESNTSTIYGSFMQLCYTMHDPKLAAKCVEYFARTRELYQGAAWLAERKEG